MPDQDFFHRRLLEQNGRCGLFKIFQHGRIIADQDVLAVIVEAENGFHSQSAALMAKKATFNRIIPLGGYRNTQQHVQQ